MKKQLLSLLFVGLLALTACNRSNSSNHSKNSTDGNNSSNTINNSSSSTNNTNDTTEKDGEEFVNGYFGESALAILNDYIDFTIPVIGETYEIEDYSTSYGIPYLVIYFNYTTANDFNSYLSTMDQTFVNDGTYYDEEFDVTYYLYSNGDWCIDVSFDDTNYYVDYSYITVEVYNENEAPGTSSDKDGYEFVDGYFHEVELAILNKYIDFTIPVTGETYEVYDNSSDSGIPYIIIYYNYITMEDFLAYLEVLDTTFINDGTYTDQQNNITYHAYLKDEWCIDVAIDDSLTYVDYSYIMVEIYNENGTVIDGIPLVDGKLNFADESLLLEALGFSIPCVGTHYEMTDYSSEYDAIYFSFYFNYVSQEDFDGLLETLDNDENIEFVSTEVSQDGLTFYCYNRGDFCIDVAYDATGYNYPYVIFDIYHSILLEA